MGCNSGMVSLVSIAIAGIVYMPETGREARESERLRCCNAELGEGESRGESSAFEPKAEAEKVSRVGFLLWEKALPKVGELGAELVSPFFWPPKKLKLSTEGRVS